MDVDLTPFVELGIAVVSAVASVAIAWLSIQANRKWGVEIDAKHREALHSALETGARKAAAKYVPTGIHIDSKPVAEIVAWAAKSTPDAIKHFGVSPETLAEMAVAKMEKVAAEKAP